MHKTRLGDLALTCAAIDDVTAWCLVAVVTGLTGAGQSAWFTFGFTLFYIVFMLLAVRPLIIRWIPRLEKKFDRLPEALLAFAILGALFSATITEAIGIHALFGAFLFGVIIPHNSLIASPQDWLICGVIIALAILGKFGGAFTGALLSGHSRRDAATLGILMNTRGLVELIVLNIGLSLGILTPTLFTMLVIMALVTTFMAGPLLRLAS